MAQPAASNAQGNGLVGIVPIALAVGLFALFCTALPLVAGGGEWRFAREWIPGLGISFALRLDGLALCFALLISGIGSLVLLYSNRYLAGHPHYARFALFLTSFMLAMLGLVLSDDLLVLFVFWELTTLTSYLLIGFDHGAGKARRNALQALFVTGAGGLAFLAGLILLAWVAGGSSLSGLLGQGDAIRDHALYGAILVLIFAGALTKSAQVPFHFWLPNAMAAPTPVSAFLHSATMVKAGVYVLARLYPALSGSLAWIWVLTLLGAATALFASLQSLRQSDLKQTLAYTTLMALGTLVMLLGQGSAYALTGFATFLVVHSLYKAALFLVVGNLDTATGTRDVARLAGLGRVMPFTALAAALAGLSMAGLPPLLGFIGKELIYAGTLRAEILPALVTLATLLANALMLAVAGVVAWRPFWAAVPHQSTTGEGRDHMLPRQPARDVGWAQWLGPLILALLGLILGLFPGLLQRALIGPMVAGLTGDAGAVRDLVLWHGLNLPLALSLATFALGFALYGAHRRLRAAIGAAFLRLPSLDRGWDRFLDGLKALAEWQTRHLQTGKLSHYLAVSFATLALGLIAAMAARGLPRLALHFDALAWDKAALGLLMLAGAVLCAFTDRRFTAIAGLGVSGIAISLIFLMFGAPDVAITQLLVETLVVVLVALALLRLPELTPRRFRPGAAALALATGGAVTVLLLAVLGQPLDLRLTAFFQGASWPEAHGRNIVNVILVDFRAIDTFGEISVVAIAALSAFALLRGTKGGQG